MEPTARDLTRARRGSSRNVRRIRHKGDHDRNTTGLDRDPGLSSLGVNHRGGFRVINALEGLPLTPIESRAAPRASGPTTMTVPHLADDRTVAVEVPAQAATSVPRAAPSEWIRGRQCGRSARPGFDTGWQPASKESDDDHGIAHRDPRLGVCVGLTARPATSIRKPPRLWPGPALSGRHGPRQLAGHDGPPNTGLQPTPLGAIVKRRG
jgi:hypothetical protein